MKNYAKNCIEDLFVQYDFPNSYKQTMCEICDKFSCDDAQIPASLLQMHGNVEFVSYSEVLEGLF